jgi:VWFA-related protein
MLNRLVCICLVLAGCVPAALAQNPLTTPPPSERPTAPSSGPLSFDVVVTDKAGHPIHGLQQSDFTVLDEKKPIPLTSFQAHEIASSPNQEAVFLVLDDVNAGFNAISIERTQIENFLRSDGGHLALPVAIFLLTDSGINQITDVSDDGNKLADVLHTKDAELHNISRAAGFWGASERLDLCLRALEGFTSYVGQVPGRKLAVWISPGWPIFDNPNVIISSKEQRNIFATIVQLSTAMRQADLTLYSIDPGGPIDAASARSFLWEDFTKPVRKPGKADPGDLALQVMVQHTGGKIFLGSNDINGEIRKCTTDALAWYSLSFDPQRADAPDTWHDIEVRVNKPGVVVRTRNGYYAQP